MFHLLTGHSAPITHIIPYENNSLLSSSEDGSIRLWDLRQNNTSAGVTIQAFRPTTTSGSISCLQTIEKGPQALIIAAIHNGLVSFDLRNTQHRQQQILVTIPYRTSITNLAQDEISDLHVNGNLLTFCSDAGEVSLMNCDDFFLQDDKKTTLIDESMIKTRLTNPGLCTSVRIWPNVREKGGKFLIASGALGLHENNVMIWNPISSRCLLSYSPDNSTNNNTNNKMCNPPHVHSLDYFGNYLFAAIGDGSIAYFRIKKDGKIFQQVQRDIHKASVVSLAVTGDNYSIPKLIASAGLDLNIAISKFDIEKGSFATLPVEESSSGGKSTTANQPPIINHNDIITYYPHPRAVNCLCWEFDHRLQSNGNIERLRLFIGDTSKDIRCLFVS
jgi:WD40 repeat protein